MTEDFKKHDQFFVNPERPEPGLTATRRVRKILWVTLR